MKLYFLRHATAQDIAPSDAERALTRDGEEEAHAAGTALAKLGVHPAQVFSSPLLRAQQTARIASKALGLNGAVTTLDELLNGTTTAVLLRVLQPWADASEILLVGHMPSLAEHVGALVSRGGPVGLRLGRAGVACVELDQLRPGTGYLLRLMSRRELALTQAPDRVTEHRPETSRT
jgi:phosphohistidine phosphatase